LRIYGDVLAARKGGGLYYQGEDGNSVYLAWGTKGIVRDIWRCLDWKNQGSGNLPGSGKEG